MIKTLCIKDNNKPDDIPMSHWVKKGIEYTVIGVYHRVQPGATMGLLLSEIDLDELDTPYSCFSSNRFRFKEEDVPELLELIKSCEGLQDFDPLELIEEEIILEEND